MFELTYDILDDLERISSTSAIERVIDNEDSVRTPEDFYREFSETGCTHLMTFRFNFHGDKRDYLTKIQELIDELLMARYPEVPKCQLVDSSRIITNPRSSLEMLIANAGCELLATSTANNKRVTAKVPLKFTGNKHCDIPHLLNFLTALHSAISVRYVYNLSVSDFIFFQPSGYKLYIMSENDYSWTTKRKMYRLRQENDENFRLWKIWAIVNYLYPASDPEEIGLIVKRWFYKFNDTDNYKLSTFEDLTSLSHYAQTKIRLNSSPECKQYKYFNL